MDRRKYLAAVGSTSIALAGCLGSDDDNNGETEAEPDADDSEETEPEPDDDDTEEGEVEPDTEADGIVLVDHEFGDADSRKMGATMQNNREDVVDITLFVRVYQDDVEIDWGRAFFHDLLVGEERTVAVNDTGNYANLSDVNDPDLVTHYELEIVEGNTADEVETLEFDGDEFRSRIIEQ